MLLPGFCAPAEILRPLGRRLERRLERPSRVLSLGFAWGDIRDLAEYAHGVLEAGAGGPDGSSSTRGIDIVGHSMGGIVAAYLLKCLDQGPRVHRVVTLGTPHRGLAIARFGHLLPGPIGRTLRQLRPGSSLLELIARLVLPRSCELISIAGLEDGLVPRSATRVPDRVGQRNVDLPGVDHLGLVLSKRGLNTLADVLQPESPDAATSRHPFERAA